MRQQKSYLRKFGSCFFYVIFYFHFLISIILVFSCYEFYWQISKLVKTIVCCGIVDLLNLILNKVCWWHSDALIPFFVTSLILVMFGYIFFSCWLFRLVVLSFFYNFLWLSKDVWFLKSKTKRYIQLKPRTLSKVARKHAIIRLPIP